MFGYVVRRPSRRESAVPGAERRYCHRSINWARVRSSTPDSVWCVLCVANALLQDTVCVWVCLTRRPSLRRNRWAYCAMRFR